MSNPSNLMCSVTDESRPEAIWLEDCQTPWRRLLLGVSVSVLRDRALHDSAQLCNYSSHKSDISPLTSSHQTAAPIVEKLDPYGFHIAYKLFRDATKSENGRPVKVCNGTFLTFDMGVEASLQDLSYLNRDLSKIILLDTDPDHCITHPENSIVIPKWKGTPGDKGLVAMIPFLECRFAASATGGTLTMSNFLAIAIYRPPDVRPILNAFHGKDIPVEYAKQEADTKKRHVEAWQQGGARRLSESGFTLSSMFGGPSSVRSLHHVDCFTTQMTKRLPSQSKSPIPPTYLEQKRAEAQMLYKEEQAYIAVNKENFERLLEEDRQAMAKEMSGNALGVVQSMFFGKQPEPPAPTATAGTGATTPEKQA